MQKEVLERSVSIPQFLEARSIEISGFMQAITAKHENKRSYQALPKSIRRRAMSHNRFRIPRRLRNGINQQLKIIQSTQRVPKCRKNIRRKPLLITEYTKRHNRIKWLNTHLWAAKRMKLIKYFGYKIALSPNDKSTRACYRFSNYACTIVDLSYHEIILIKFTDVQSLERVLSNHITLDKSKILNNQQYLECDFYINGKLVCPVYIFLNNVDAYIIYHPAAHEQFANFEPKQGTKSILIQKVDIYRMIGPESLSKLHTLLEQFDGQLGNNFEKFKSLKNPNYFKKNEIFSINLNSTEKKMTSAPSIPFSSYIKEKYSNEFTNNLRNMLMKQILTQSQQNTRTNDCYFWEKLVDDPHATTKFQIVTRSKYTHRRKRGKQESLGKNIKNKEQTKQLVKKNPIQQIEIKKKPVKKLIEVEEKKILVSYQQQKKKNQEQNVLIGLINNQSKVDGCLIIGQNFNHSQLWRKLTFLNCKVIGRKQYCDIMRESQLKVYPQDYPETQGYALHFENIRTNKIAKYRKLPFSKGVNYQKINSPFPFGPDFQLISKGSSFQQNYIFVKCRYLGRGSCKQHSYICEPLQQDITIAKNSILQNKALSYVHKEAMIQFSQQQQQQLDIQIEIKPQQAKNNIKQLDDQELLKHFYKINTTRRIIGFATAGGFNFSISHGYAHGYIKKQFKDYPYLLIRRTTSPYYFLAEVLRASSDN